jgi:phospholipid/cholesterol/gamma-HCH transport system substrate-binding protein
MPSAQRIEWAKIRITVLSITALSILAVLVYLLGGSTWFKEQIYLTVFIPDSLGLQPGSDVELNGVEIGTVDWLRLTKSKDLSRVVEVRLKIQKEFLLDIPKDSRASLDSGTLLGDKVVNINRGTNPEHVRPGGEIGYQAPSNFVKSIDLTQFSAQLKAIDQTIRDIQAGKGSLGQFVVSDDLYKRVIGKIAGLENSLRQATSVHSTLGQLMYSAQAYDDLRPPLRRLDDRLAQVQSNPLLRDSAQYDQIRDQIVKVRRSLADLNAGKGAGGQFLTSDADYAEWNKRLVSWIDSIDAINDGNGAFGGRLATGSDYQSWTGAFRNLGTSVREFRENPQKFLRLKLF